MGHILNIYVGRKGERKKGRGYMRRFLPGKRSRRKTVGIREKGRLLLSSVACKEKEGKERGGFSIHLSYLKKERKKKGGQREGY